MKGPEERSLTDQELDQVLHDSTVFDDLVRIGLIVHSQNSDDRKGLRGSPHLRLFLPMFRNFEIRLVPFERPDGCPVSFCTGLLKPGRGTQPGSLPDHHVLPSGGQGMNLEKAALSCIGEMAERVSLFPVDAADARIFTWSEEQSEVGISSILGFSAKQERSLIARLQLPQCAVPDGGVDWRSLSQKRVSVTCLGTGRKAEVPDFAVLFRGGAEASRGVPGVASTVGCAVWRNRQGARERALLELAERDAVAQAWYNRLGITPLSDALLSQFLPAAISRFLKDSQATRIVCTIDTDLPVHVVCAISHDGRGYRAAFGSAARWNLAAACESAVLELLQSENSLELMEKAYPEEIRSGSVRVPRHLAYARTRSILEDFPFEEGATSDLIARGGSDTAFSVSKLIQWCLDRGFDVWEFDATRSDLNIPCIKLLSADLCSWEPRFGKSRLFNGVVERGLRTVPADEAEFAARPFPF